jgi:hypothetical protein
MRIVWVCSYQAKEDPHFTVEVVKETVCLDQTRGQFGRVAFDPAFRACMTDRLIDGLIDCVTDCVGKHRWLTDWPTDHELE